MSSSFPKLRWPLVINPFTHQGRSFVSVEDPAGLLERPVVFPKHLVPILARFDGHHTVESIVKEGSAYGVTEELVRKFLEELDDLYLLDTDRSSGRKIELEKEFQAQVVRKSVHANLVYPADPDVLRTQIDSYHKDTKSTEDHFQKSVVDAIISPHIDYRRGWECYASAYQKLKSATSPDVIVLIGTSHQYAEGIFHICNKSFESPLGTFTVDSEAVIKLSSTYGKERSFKSEYLHKHEHSLELQLPFLAHTYLGASSLPQIVPILVGSFSDCVHEQKQPNEFSEISDFIEACSEMHRDLLQRGKRILWLAGIDLTHIGKQFGDLGNVCTEDSLREVEARDREFLNCVFSKDAESLFEHIASDFDKRRICGFPTLYTMLSVFERLTLEVSGSLIDYRQAVDFERDHCVSFASGYLQLGNS